MEKQQRIAEVKQLIAEGEVEKALEQLLSFLESRSAYLNMHSDALQAMSQYKTTRREEAKGTISHEEARRSYSKITDLTLNILEELEQEEKAEQPSRRRWTLIAGLVALLVIGGGAFWWLSKDQTGNAQQGFICPDFGQGKKYKVLVFPYYAPGKPEKFDIPTASSIAARLADFGTEYNLSIGSKLINLPPQLSERPEQKFPLRKEGAEKTGNKCQARLVIWGISEQSDDTRHLTTSYKFLFPEGEQGLNMTKLELSEQTEVNQIQFLSSIITGGKITEDIEKAFKYFAGIIAHESGDDEAAIDQLKELAVQDDSSALMRNMILADSYLRTGKDNEAMATYDSVLQTHPDYWLGWHNRGLLYLKQGDYDNAILDLNRRLELKDTDTVSLLARGQAYLATEQLSKAEQDLEKADSLQPNSRIIRSKLKTVRRKIDVQEGIRKNAREQLRNNPDDREARRRLIQADLKLGYTQEALQNSEALLQNQGNKEEALEIFDLFRKQNEFSAAEKILKEAAQKNILSNQEAKSINRQILQPKIETELQRKQ